jgi:transcriptional regulator with XRE-family HTH domain
MADIYKFVKKSNNSRPLYTSYELSKNVKDKRIGEGISEAEFASKYGITMELLQRIEEGNSSFSPKLYRVCGKILGLSTEELLSEINDDMAAANDSNVQGTFDLANMLFNEIIMQKKIGIN